MRWPRIRFTVRQLMIIAAIVALILAVPVWVMKLRKDAAVFIHGTLSPAA